MAIVFAMSGQTINLGTGQSGNTDTTNILDRGFVHGASNSGQVLIRIQATAGSTPTVTVTPMYSVDGTNWYNTAIIDPTTPGTTATTFTITSTTTGVFKYTHPDVPWRYFKVNFSSNTNITAIVTDATPI